MSLCVLSCTFPDQKSRAPRSRKPTGMVKKEDVAEEPLTHESVRSQNSHKRPKNEEKHVAADSKV